MKEFSLLFPASVHFGYGALDKITSVKMPTGTVAIVTGGSSMKRTGALDRLISLLKPREAAVFGGVEPEVSVETVDRCAEFLRKNNAATVIGIGGGSALDCAKAAAGIFKSGKSVKDFLDGKEKVADDTAYFIAVPTTAGTGSETTKNAVLTYTEKKIKISLRGDTLVPKAVICDPGLTLSLPPDITAHTGMDALTHAVESFVSTAANDITRALSAKAVNLIMDNMLTAYKNGHDREARYNMLTASFAAGIAFANAGLGAVHGIGHSAGATAKLPHGLVNALLLPAVMGYNKKRAPEPYKALEKECGKNLINRIRDLNRKTGIPARLSELDKDVASKLPAMIGCMAFTTGSMTYNPAKIDAAAAEEILRSAI